MRLLVETLQEGDTVALATYAGRVARVLEPTSGANTRAIISPLNRFDQGQRPCLLEFDIAYDMAWEAFEPVPKTVSLFFLMATPMSETLGGKPCSAKSKAMPIVLILSTIGLGMGNYKDTTMEQRTTRRWEQFYIDHLKKHTKSLWKASMGP